MIPVEDTTGFFGRISISVVIVLSKVHKFLQRQITNDENHLFFVFEMGDSPQKALLLPSGYLLHSHGKSPVLIGKPL